MPYGGMWPRRGVDEASELPTTSRAKSAAAIPLRQMGVSSEPPSRIGLKSENRGIALALLPSAYTEPIFGADLTLQVVTPKNRPLRPYSPPLWSHDWDATERLYALHPQSGPCSSCPLTLAAEHSDLRNLAPTIGTIYRLGSSRAELPVRPCRAPQD